MLSFESFLSRPFSTFHLIGSHSELEHVKDFKVIIFDATSEQPIYDES